MGGGYQFFDIILFALIAVFVILRLRSVLGKRTGHEQKNSNPFRARRVDAPETARDDAQGTDEDENDNVVRLPGRDGQEIRSDTPLGAGLTQIALADQSFDPSEFAEKARAAFEYIVAAFAEGSTEKLKPLLSKDVYDGFADAIKERKEKSWKLETDLVRIMEAELLEASMQGRVASITVKYTTEQINVTHDKDGNVMDGDPDHIAEVVDIWTYERDSRATNPNWVLVATETPQ